VSTALTLYAIEEGLLALLDTAEMTAEGTDERLEILDEIAQTTTAAVQKRDQCIRFLRHLDLQQAAIATEIARLRALMDSYAKGQERVERYVVSVIERFAPEPKRGAKRIEGTIGILSLWKNPDSVEILDEKLIPERFMVTPPAPAARPDKAAIKAALKAGDEVAGADLRFGSNSLRIL
jgi:hypothetical protein